MKRGMFITETFNGVNEFLSVIGKRKLNKVFQDREPASECGSYGFTMTKSYTESVELMTTGYKEGLNSLKKCKGAAIHHTDKVIKRIPQAGIVGYAPHVPNAIAGIPQSMISTQKIEQQAKVLTIVYSGEASSSVEAEEFVKAGRNILDLVMMLELQGYRVRVDIQDSFCSRDECAIMRITVKDHRQPINPLKISYLMLHPSFYRRQGFKWLETVPELTNTSFASGYGKPLYYHVGSKASSDDIRKYLKKHQLLEDRTFFTNFYEAVDNTAEELVQLMGIKSKK